MSLDWENDDSYYTAGRDVYQAEEAAEREFRHYEREIGRLRALLRANGINPDAFQKVKEVPDEL
jgi:hypothetical protein